MIIETIIHGGEKKETILLIIDVNINVTIVFFS